MDINVIKLTEELTDAGIPNEGCNSDGKIYFLPSATKDQIAYAQVILAKHTSAPTKDQKLAELGIDAKMSDLIYVVNQLCVKMDVPFPDSLVNVIEMHTP